MALHIDAPVLLKIRDGINVNVSLAVSMAIERDAPKREIKPEVRKLYEEGKRNGALTDDDYVEVGKVDTVSFWFIGGTSLTYRVGAEITQDDFDRIDAQLKSIEFKPKVTNDRDTGNIKVTKPLEE